MGGRGTREPTEPTNGRFDQENFEHYLPTCILRVVSKLTRFFATLTLALYGLASEHCKLEAMPAFSFLRCCCSSESSPTLPRDCSQDVCGSVESGACKSEDQSAVSPVPVLVLAVVLPLADEARTRSASAAESFGPAPPELPRFWQFSYRAALPPRAPSFAS